MKRFFAAVLCLCVILGLAGCGSFEDVLASAINYAESDTAQYNKILDDAGVVHSSPIFGDNIFSYVSTDSDGYVYCADYVYDKDVVTSWAETSYIPIQGLSESQIFEIDMALRENLAYLDAVKCCSVRYNQSGDYYKVTCVFSETDKAENYADLFKAELIDQETAVSMKATEDGLLEQKYVKK